MTIHKPSGWLVVLPLLLLALLATPVEARKKKAEPIYVPDPIQVPAGKSVEQVRQVIRKTLFSRKWEAREAGTGLIEGKYTKSGRKASTTTIVVNIRYDARAIRIAYKDSENMSYDAKAGTINRNYNSWVRGVESVIRKELGSY